MGIQLNFKNARVGWMNVFEKAKDSIAQNGDTIKGKYGFTVYMGEDDPQIDKMEAEILEYLSGPECLKSVEAAKKWMSKNFGFGNHSDKCAVRDLAERDKPIEGMETGLYFKATTHKHIEKVQTSLGENQASQNQKAIKGLTMTGDDVEGQEVYSGCYANIRIDFWWSKEYKNLCASPLGIRFKAEGTSFGGSSASVSDDDLSDEDEKPTRSRRSRDEDDEDEERPRRRRNRDED